jgi:hypothetical protein
VLSKEGNKVVLDTGSEHGESGGRDRKELSASLDDRGIKEECFVATGVDVSKELVEGFTDAATDELLGDNANGIDMVGVINGLGGGDRRNCFLSCAVFCADVVRGTRRSLVDKSGIVRLTGIAVRVRTEGERGLVVLDGEVGLVLDWRGVFVTLGFSCKSLLLSLSDKASALPQEVSKWPELSLKVGSCSKEVERSCATREGDESSANSSCATGDLVPS